MLRISIMQMTTVVTNYYNDQLKNDIEREDRIATDKITRQQAELEDEEWQAVCRGINRFARMNANISMTISLYEAQ